MESASTPNSQPPERLTLPFALALRNTLKRYNLHSPYYSYNEHVLIYLDLLNQLSFEAQHQTHITHLDKLPPNTKFTATYPYLNID